MMNQRTAVQRILVTCHHNYENGICTKCGEGTLDGKSTYALDNNEITNGYNYDGELTKMSDDSLNDKRKYINPIYNDQAKVYKKQIKELYEL